MAVAGAGAHRPDLKLLAGALDAIVVGRPAPTEEAPQPLGADHGYDDEACYQEAEGHDDLPQLRARGEEQRATREISGDRARRWVVAVGHSWLHRFRTLLVRFEKNLATHFARLQLACAYLVLKRAEVFR
jgi:putative transposase